MKHLPTLLLIAVLALLCGCETEPTTFGPSVLVNGLAAQNVNFVASFFILPGDKDVLPADLQFIEFAGILEKALIQRGFHRAASLDEADMAIYLAYGIGPPQERVYSYSLPVFGQTGVSSSTTYGTISGSQYGFGSFSSTTQYTPSYGVIGYRTQIGSHVTFTRHIFVEAMDLTTYRSQKKAVQLWKTGIASTSQSGDLRLAFPVMVKAATPYFGVDTGYIRPVTYVEEPFYAPVKGLPLPAQK